MNSPEYLDCQECGCPYHVEDSDARQASRFCGRDCEDDFFGDVEDDDDYYGLDEDDFDEGDEDDEDWA